MLALWSVCKSQSFKFFKFCWSCHSEPLPHLLGLKGVLCLLPPNQRTGVVSEFVRKADSVGGICGWLRLCCKLVWNRAFLGTQKSFCRWIRIFYTHSSQNAVPKSATWGLPNLAIRSQRVNISGFEGQEATCNLCHSYTTDVVWKWPETLGQWMSAAVFTGVRNRWQDIWPRAIACWPLS